MRATALSVECNTFRRADTNVVGWLSLDRLRIQCDCVFKLALGKGGIAFLSQSLCGQVTSHEDIRLIRKESSLSLAHQQRHLRSFLWPEGLQRSRRPSLRAPPRPSPFQKYPTKGTT